MLHWAKHGRRLPSIWHAAPMFHIADLIWFSAVSLWPGTHVIISRCSHWWHSMAIEKHNPVKVLVPVMLQLLWQSDKLRHKDVSSCVRIALWRHPLLKQSLSMRLKSLPTQLFHTSVWSNWSLAPSHLCCLQNYSFCFWKAKAGKFAFSRPCNAMSADQGCWRDDCRSCHGAECRANRRKGNHHCWALLRTNTELLPNESADGLSY